jgi:hypothetical protein
LDIWEYHLQKEREFADAGCTLEEPPSAVFQAEEDSDGRRGRVIGTLRLMADPIDAYVEVYERVLIVDGHTGDGALC